MISLSDIVKQVKLGIGANYNRVIEAYHMQNPILHCTFQHEPVVKNRAKPI